MLDESQARAFGDAAAERTRIDRDPETLATNSTGSRTLCDQGGHAGGSSEIVARDPLEALERPESIGLDR